MAMEKDFFLENREKNLPYARGWGIPGQRDALQFSPFTHHLTQSFRDRSLHFKLKNGLE